MGFFQNYVNYLKDNPKHYWFKRKLYGWGWTPATGEGWLTTLIFVAGIFGYTFLLLVNPNPTDANLMSFYLQILVFMILFLYICATKGQKLKWQWGSEK